METFSALLALCAGNWPVTGELPAQRPVMLSFDVFFDLRLNKRLSNNSETGDLRRHYTHYDVTVIMPAGSLDLEHWNKFQWNSSHNTNLCYRKPRAPNSGRIYSDHKHCSTAELMCVSLHTSVFSLAADQQNGLGEKKAFDTLARATMVTKRKLKKYMHLLCLLLKARSLFYKHSSPQLKAWISKYFRAILPGEIIIVTSWWARLRIKSSVSPLFTQLFIQAQLKENVKASRHWPLCGEFTGHRWIPRTNGQ